MRLLLNKFLFFDFLDIVRRYFDFNNRTFIKFVIFCRIESDSEFVQIFGYFKSAEISGESSVGRNAKGILSYRKTLYIIFGVEHGYNICGFNNVSIVEKIEVIERAEAVIRISTVCYFDVEIDIFISVLNNVGFRNRVQFE